METKKCTRCGTEKPKEDEYFRLRKKSSPKYKKVSYITYFNSWCRDCEKEHSREASKAYYEKNKEACIARVNEWRKHSMHKTREYNKKSNKTNAKRYKEYSKKYRQENAEKIREQERVRREKNRERYNVYAQKKRSLKRKLPSAYTKKQWEECMAYFDGECAYCGSAEKLTQEHFIPMTDGGEYADTNIIPACRHCNSSKRDRSFFDWYPEKKYYSKKREQKILKYLGYKKNDVDLLKSGHRQLRIILE